MLTTLPLMSLFLAGAALLFIHKKTLIPIVVFVYRMYSLHRKDLGFDTEIVLTATLLIISIRCRLLPKPGPYTIYPRVRELPTCPARGCESRNFSFDHICSTTDGYIAT